MVHLSLQDTEVHHLEELQVVLPHRTPPHTPGRLHHTLRLCCPRKYTARQIKLTQKVHCPDKKVNQKLHLTEKKSYPVSTLPNKNCASC